VICSMIAACYEWCETQDLSEADWGLRAGSSTLSKRSCSVGTWHLAFWLVVMEAPAPLRIRATATEGNGMSSANHLANRQRHMGLCCIIYFADGWIGELPVLSFGWQPCVLMASRYL
jgi:hypothetical protein